MHPQARRRAQSRQPAIAGLQRQATSWLDLNREPAALLEAAAEQLCGQAAGRRPAEPVTLEQQTAL